VEPSPAPGRVELTAERIGSEVRITVRDNGAGFDPALHDPSARVGLLNVTRRLELSYPGSKFRIESAPGKGCLVEIAIDPEGSRL
jgi:signal transduction histidine kinase